MTIPKIIHQLWIGPHPAPIKLMNTWKEKHPDFEYILWNESEFVKRGVTFRTAAKMELTEICGKVDMMRWELLYRYGGVFIDADSICIEPLDDVFMNKSAFATYENENARKDLIANGNMGFPVGHPLCRDIIEWILSDESDDLIRGFKAWYSVGPALLTKFLNTGKYSDFSVFPSHCFLPIHFTGNRYEGHKKVYAHQLWGSANSYETMDEKLPSELANPDVWVSILIPIYNTPQFYLRECFDSIKLQNGYFGMEVVVINDGCDQEHSQILESELEHFTKNVRFTKVIYEKWDKNMGIGYSLHHGLLKCTNELVFRMDGDDIMLPERIKMQIAFMKQNPESVICGTAIQPFQETNSNKTNKTNRKIFLNEKNHPFEYTWDEFVKERSDWIINHPTVCFRKSAILSVGNYRTDLRNTEDYDLFLRVLKKYKKIHSLPNVLLFYRLHTNQTTYINNCTENLILKKTILDRVLCD